MGSDRVRVASKNLEDQVIQVLKIHSISIYKIGVFVFEISEFRGYLMGEKTNGIKRISIQEERFQTTL